MMDSERHRAAFILLIVFILGGLFAPLLHRIQHEYLLHLEEVCVGALGHPHGHFSNQEPVYLGPVREACTGCALCAGIVFWTDLESSHFTPLQFSLSFSAIEYQSISTSNVYRASARAPPVSAFDHLGTQYVQQQGGIDCSPHTAI